MSPTATTNALWISGLGAAAALLTFLGAALIAPRPAEAADEHPCGGITTRAGKSVQYCPLWMPARGYVPVHQFAADGTPVERGRLVAAGSMNWFVCESRTPDGVVPKAYADPAHPYRNGWWAKTLSDDGVWGWTNEIYFTGGDDEEPDAGLRPCEGGPSAPPTTTPAAAGSTAGCKELVEDQRMTVPVSAHERFQNSWFNQSSGTPTNGDPYGEEDFDAGRIELSAATCLTEAGDWKIVLPVWAAAQYNGLKIGEGLTGDRAVGAIVRSYAHSTSETDPYERARLRVEIFDCAERNQWKVFNAIVSFPIPGVSYLVDLAQWAYGTWGPEDKPACQTLGTMSLRLGVLESVSTCRKSGRAVRRPLCRPTVKRWDPARRWRPAKRRWSKRNWRSVPGGLLVRTADTTFRESWQQSPGAGSSPITTTHTMRVRIGP